MKEYGMVLTNIFLKCIRGINEIYIPSVSQFKEDTYLLFISTFLYRRCLMSAESQQLIAAIVVVIYLVGIVSWLLYQVLKYTKED